MAACGRTVGLTFHLKRLCIQPKYLGCIQTVRYRWRPPDPDEDILPSYAQRLAEWKALRDNSPASTGINIGFPFKSSTNSQTSLTKLKQWSKMKSQKEKAARHRYLKLDMDEVHKEWVKESGPRHVCRVAEHYGIFRDLFDGAHFNPVTPLDVWYDYDDEFVTPVKYGNIVPAKEACIPPTADYPAPEDSLWTLVMCSPDGNLEDNDRELLHWMVGNIPANDVESGDSLCNYLQPFPVKGAGFLRYVLVLYKQNGRLDYSSFQKSPDCVSLRERSFSTLEFYRKFEDDLTPAGLAFFQSEWDGSVRNVFHNVLDMPEPKFEFIHPPHYFPMQEEVPHRRYFNMYLDNYRDVKDLNEEILKVKLKDHDPTQPPPPKPKFTNIDLLPKSVPSWYRSKVQHQRLGKFHWRDLYAEPKE